MARINSLNGLTGLLLILLPGVTALAETGSSDDEKKAQTDQTQIVVSEDLPSTEPQENKAAKKEITSAIESFTPTEEISADNAVPFPVDI